MASTVYLPGLPEMSGFVSSQGFVHKGSAICFFPTSLVIAIDGACRGNGKSSATASYGIYIGEENSVAGRWNECKALRGKPTSQRAEIVADLRDMLRALTLAKNWKRLMGSDLEDVVIKSDSEYVVRGITEWIFKWEQNGWRNVNRMPIANKKPWKTLKYRMGTVKRKGVRVIFWRVPREYNQAADDLAYRALGPV